MRVPSFFPLLAATVAAACLAWPAPAAAQDGAAELRAFYDKSAASLASSPFGRPVLLSSSETDKGLKGEVYGVLDRPLTEVSRALDTPTHWCGMLMLHLNNRRCRADDAKQQVTLSVVRRYDLPLDEAADLSFDVRGIVPGAEYFDTTLTSGKGPYGTSNYRISLQGIPLDKGRSFIHFSYAYDQSGTTSLASKTYLATFGSGKVGFTVVGKNRAGQPEFIDGMLGLIERNAMRYFLAVDAYTAAPGDVEKQLALWHAGAQKYPRQLNDYTEANYLRFKHEDMQRAAR